MQVNLSDRFQRALLESNYQHLVTLGTFVNYFVNRSTLMLIRDSGNVPDMGTILAAFISHGSLDPCPYIEGYCGEHQYEYPGLEQKSGPHRILSGMYFYVIFYWSH
jgi:hypothetical protein